MYNGGMNKTDFTAMRKLNYFPYIPKLGKMPCDSKPEEVESGDAERKILEYIRHMPSHIHITFFYENTSSIDKVLSAFFDRNVTSKAAKGLLTEKPFEPTHVNNLLYSKILPAEKHSIIKKLSTWVDAVHSANKSNEPTRIADADTTWWFRNDLGKEHQKLEQTLGKYLVDNMSVLCAYNISNISKDKLSQIVESHGIVIFDNPFMAYAWAGHEPLIFLS